MLRTDRLRDFAVVAFTPEHESAASCAQPNILTCGGFLDGRPYKPCQYGWELAGRKPLQTSRYCFIKHELKIANI